MLSWVFGASAVGKKHFILHAHQFDAKWNGYRPTAMADQPPSLQHLVRLSQEYTNLLVRWQWGREQLLVDLHDSHPHIEQSIVLITAKLRVHFRRASQRECGEKWPKSNLAHEARAVKSMAQEVGKQCSVSPIRIDTTHDSPELWEEKLL